MNRKDEYMNILSQLKDTPIKLDYTYERALARYREYKRRRTKRALLAPGAALVAVFAMFVLLVNISPTFAYAAGRIPFIADLAKFVAYSPSLSAAVENEYVQPMGLEKTQDGIKARIEYVIVDQKQLNIFYSLESGLYSRLTAYADISSTDESELPGHSIVSGMAPEDGGLQKITVDFSEGQVPSSLNVMLRIKDEGSLYGVSEAPEEYSYEDSFFRDDEPESGILTEIPFALNFDPMYTEKGETIGINRPVTLDGQKLTFVRAEIYPTHMRLIFDDREENSAWLKGLDFYVENEKGERFDGIKNGISAYGKEDSPMTATYMLESAFFSDSENLSLVITGTSWLDKDMERLRIDLENETAEALPEGVSLVSAEKRGSGWLLKFTGTQKDSSHNQLWSMEAYDAQGKKYEVSSMSYTALDRSLSDGDGENLPGDAFEVMFPLRNYPYDEVWLCPISTRSVTLDVPVRLEIK